MIFSGVISMKKQKFGRWSKAALQSFFNHFRILPKRRLTLYSGTAVLP